MISLSLMLTKKKSNILKIYKQTSIDLVFVAKLIQTTGPECEAGNVELG